jgi:hypothetical protein
MPRISIHILLSAIQILNVNFMKKIFLEDSIKNAFVLIKSGVHHAVVLFALKSDGLSAKQSQVIVRWALVNKSAKKPATIIDMFPIE